MASRKTVILRSGRQAASRRTHDAYPMPGRRFALRLGFRQIKGFSEEDANRLVAARGDGYPDAAALWHFFVAHRDTKLNGVSVPAPERRALRLATIAGQRTVVVAMDRHAFGDAAAKQGPDAFRLAQRAIRLADRLGLPVLTLIDTPGADPSPRSEAAGLAGDVLYEFDFGARLRRLNLYFVHERAD